MPPPIDRGMVSSSTSLMDFISRITRSPIAFDPERGAEIAALYGDIPPALSDLIQGTAGCAPYLANLLRVEVNWLSAFWSIGPEAAARQVIFDVGALSSDQLAVGLRQAKRRMAILAALCDLGGVWDLMQVTTALTELADASVHRALCAGVETEINRGKLPGLGADDVADAGGLFALAMGKMGAFELNYSSDIDLICLYDDSRFAPEDQGEARAAFIRVVRKMSALLSDITDDGYVFRTDLRLRPDPSVTPVCISVTAAERYYESVGRTWERAAFIKARACAGAITAGERFLKDMTPFVWRRHLDFAAIQDAHDMRLRIRSHKGLGGALKLEGHHMKLGMGGIREIEFFTQTRQLIAGGRDLALRTRGTLAGLTALADAEWITPDVAETLSADYIAHREIEHRVQMINDAQTHLLPNSDEGFARLAAFCGQTVAALRATLTSRLERVHNLIEGFYETAPVPGAAGDHVRHAGHVDTKLAPEISESGRDIISRWRGYPALRSERAVELFRRLEPELLARVACADRPDEALLHLDGFLAGLPTGVQLFALFNANPQLIDLVVDICSTAPGLAQYLARNSGVFDAVIGGDFFAPWPGQDDLADQLDRFLTTEPDYERALDAARRWAKEWHFRIGVHQLRALLSADEAGAQYADLAGAVIKALWPRVTAEFEAKHGPQPGRGAMVLAMGSLGAGRLTAASDLDIIVIYDNEDVDTSTGRRPLAARPYYARLTQSLVTAMTALTAEGRLYEVDMRLRPSGRKGPVATSWGSFVQYQMTEAWTWEHLALTRARVIAGAPALAADVEAFRQELMAQPRDFAKLCQDTSDMRARLSEAKPARDDYEPKAGPGRMMDIELLAEAGALMAGLEQQSVYDQLRACQDLWWIDADDLDTLIKTYRLTWRLQSAARLLHGERLDFDKLGAGSAEFLLREARALDLGDLADRLVSLAAQSDAIITRALQNPPAGGGDSVADLPPGTPVSPAGLQIAQSDLPADQSA